MFGNDINRSVFISFCLFSNLFDVRDALFDNLGFCLVYELTGIWVRAKEGRLGLS